MAKQQNDDSQEGATPELVGDTTTASPDRERISARAYELYLARGGADGQAEDDWLTAERQLSDGGETPRES